MKIFAWDALRLKYQYPGRVPGGSEPAFERAVGLEIPVQASIPQKSQPPP